LGTLQSMTSPRSRLARGRLFSRLGVGGLDQHGHIGPGSTLDSASAVTSTPADASVAAPAPGSTPGASDLPLNIDTDISLEDYVVLDSEVGEDDILDDFILVAEFSELVGPVPVDSIPSNFKTGIDHDAFVLRIMAVDFQSTVCVGDKFKVVADTQAFLARSRSYPSAYVHHFTLFDINARGYVRPFVSI